MTSSKDKLGIDELDFVEIFCANGRQSLYFYSTIFGLTPVAFRGPETGYPDAATFVLNAGKINLLLTTPLKSKNIATNLLATHGDTVRSIAFRVTDCAAFYKEALAGGAESAAAPTELRDTGGTVKMAAIKTYGDTIHEIVERKNYDGPFLPGFEPYASYSQEALPTAQTGVERIDHIVGNVELGKMEYWVKFYEDVLGFTEMLHFSDKDISTEYSALMSKVMRSGTGKIKFPINEPATGKRKSQIEEYLEFHGGPGVQHIALQTKDIIATISAMKNRGLEFLHVPHTYYEALGERIGPIREDIGKLGELGILADRDDDGYLLQIFTKPVH